MKTQTKGIFRKIKDEWEINTKVKIDGTFRHFEKKGYKTLSEAKNDYERALKEFEKTHTKHHEVMFFEDLLEKYKKYRSCRVNPSTLISDNSIYHKHLKAFNNKLLKDCFNVDNISEWYSTLVHDKRLSDNKKSKIITRVKDIINYAYLHRYIDSEVKQDCDVIIFQVKSNKKAKTERVVWTADEENAFFEAIKDYPNEKDYIMFKIMLVCGLRLGELLGLQGQCFKDNSLEIKQQVISLQGGWELTDILKSHESYRKVVLPSELSKSLKDYIKTFKIGNDDFIFYTYSRKKPISRSELRRKLYRYCDIAGIRRANPHALRHNQAVKLASVCLTMQDIENAAKRLGHSPSMFANTYANHTSEEAQKELLNRLYS